MTPVTASVRKCNTPLSLGGRRVVLRGAFPPTELAKLPRRESRDVCDAAVVGLWGMLVLSILHHDFTVLRASRIITGHAEDTQHMACIAFTSQNG